MSLFEFQEGVPPLHTTKDFAVYVGPMQDSEWRGRTGYLLVNLRTHVIEGECSVEYAAIRTMHDVQAALTETISSGSGPVVSDDQFEQMIRDMKKREH